MHTLLGSSIVTYRGYPVTYVDYTNTKKIGVWFRGVEGQLQYESVDPMTMPADTTNMESTVDRSKVLQFGAGTVRFARKDKFGEVIAFVDEKVSVEMSLAPVSYGPGVEPPPVMADMVELTRRAYYRKKYCSDPAVHDSGCRCPPLLAYTAADNVEMEEWYGRLTK